MFTNGFNPTLSPLAVAFILFALACGASAQSHPIPPGARQAGQASDQTDKNIPPPMSAQKKIDLVKLSRQADELSAMAQTIPGDVASIQKGMLPKDVIQKLRRIEKLSKSIRSQLEQ